MREMGLEPTRSYNHKILSLACLPIPALPRNESNLIMLFNYCQCFLKNIYKKQFEKNWKKDIDIIVLVYYNSYCCCER